VYAITFDLDTQTLEQSYGSASWRNAYADIRNVLASHGFDWQQGSVYFGGDEVNAVTCVVATQDLTRRFPWFRPSVRDIRMLRIEENNDLGPAIESAMQA
jgi:virulence-associated protein VapD